MFVERRGLRSLHASSKQLDKLEFEEQYPVGDDLCVVPCWMRNIFGDGTQAVPYKRI